MKGFGQKLLVVLIALPIFVYVVLEARNLKYFLSHQREPAQFVLKDNFKGWVVLTFDSECDPVQKQDDKFEYRIPESGWLCVAEPRQRGFSQDSVVYENHTKQNLLKHPGTKANFVWLAHKRTLPDETLAFAFYVGYAVPKKERSRVIAELEDKISKKLEEVR